MDVSPIIDKLKEAYVEAQEEITKDSEQIEIIYNRVEKAVTEAFAALDHGMAQLEDAGQEAKAILRSAREVKDDSP